MTHVYKVQAAYEDGKERKFSLQDDLHKLKAACLEVSNVGLIIIDPASSYMGGKLDGRQNTQVRAVLDPISKLAEDLNVAVLSVTHFNKGTAAKAIHRVMDSAAFVTAPRAVFGVFPDPDDGLGEEAQFVDTKNFVPLKTNIGPLRHCPGWKYHMEQVSAGTDHRDGSAIMATRIVWDGKAEMTADEIVAAENAKPSPRLNEAIAFLREMLANGPKLVNEIKAQGARNEIAEETLKRAKRKLKIVHYVEGPGEPWFWSLPGKDFADDDPYA